MKLDAHKALICLVGEDIRGHSGMAAKVFNAVKHVNIRMISQGASEINMSFVIDEKDVEDWWLKGKGLYLRSDIRYEDVEEDDRALEKCRYRVGRTGVDGADEEEVV